MDLQFLICVVSYLLCMRLETEAYVSFVPRPVGLSEDPCGPTLAAQRANRAQGLPNSPHVPPPSSYFPPQRGSNIQPPIEYFRQPTGQFSQPSGHVPQTPGQFPQPTGHVPQPVRQSPPAQRRNSNQRTGAFPSPIDNAPVPTGHFPPDPTGHFPPEPTGLIQPPTGNVPQPTGNNQPPSENVLYSKGYFPSPTSNILQLTPNDRGQRRRVKRQMPGYAPRQQPAYDYDLPDFYMPGAGGGMGQPYGSMGQPYGGGGGMGPNPDGPDMPYGGYPGQMPYGGMPPYGYDADYPMGMYPGSAQPYGIDPQMAAAMDIDVPPQMMYPSNQWDYNQYGGAPSYGSPYEPSPSYGSPYEPSPSYGSPYEPSPPWDPYGSPYGSRSPQNPFAPRDYPQTPAWPPSRPRYRDPYTPNQVLDVFPWYPSTPSPAMPSNANVAVGIQANTGGNARGQVQPLPAQNQPTDPALGAGLAGSVSPGNSNNVRQAARGAELTVSGGSTASAGGVMSGQAHSVSHETQAAGSALSAGPTGSASSAILGSIIQKLHPSLPNTGTVVDASQPNVDYSLTQNVNNISGSNATAQVGPISGVTTAPSTTASDIPTTTSPPIRTTAPSQAGPGLSVVLPGTSGSHGPVSYQSQATGSSGHGSAVPSNPYQDSPLMRSFYNIPPSGGTIPSPTYHVQAPDSRYRQGYYDFSSPSGRSRTHGAPNPRDPYNTPQSGTPYDIASAYSPWQDPYQSPQSPQPYQPSEPASPQNCYCELAGECYPGPTIAGARYGTQCDSRLNLVCCCN